MSDQAKWVRLFNRLDIAITRHEAEIGDSAIDADKALYAAHAKVMRDAAKEGK